MSSRNIQGAVSLWAIVSDGNTGCSEHRWISSLFERYPEPQILEIKNPSEPQTIRPRLLIRIFRNNCEISHRMVPRNEIWMKRERTSLVRFISFPPHLEYWRSLRPSLISSYIQSRPECHWDLRTNTWLIHYSCDDEESPRQNSDCLYTLSQYPDR